MSCTVDHRAQRNGLQLVVWRGACTLPMSCNQDTMRDDRSLRILGTSFVASRILAR